MIIRINVSIQGIETSEKSDRIRVQSIELEETGIS